MNWFRTSLLTLALWLSVAAAQTLAEGTEVLLTDLESQVIVGHGVVSEGVLRLELGSGTRGFFLYMVSPGGDISSYNGAVEPDGGIGVLAEDGTRLDLRDLLAQQGVLLELQRVPAVTAPASFTDTPGVQDN